ITRLVAKDRLNLFNRLRVDHLLRRRRDASVVVGERDGHGVSFFARSHVTQGAFTGICSAPTRRRAGNFGQTPRRTVQDVYDTCAVAGARSYAPPSFFS